VSRYQKGKTYLIWILLKQEAVSGSGISWATCKSAPRSRQITTPHHASTPPLMFYRPDALPAAQPTASMHCAKILGVKLLFLYLMIWQRIFSCDFVAWQGEW